MESKKLLVAAAVAGLVSAGSAVTNSVMAAEKKGQCHGVNACKGKSKCHTKDHACGGQNACKGKGWLKMTKKECEQAILKAAAEKGMKFKEG